MTSLAELMREYERKRYPADRRLDVHAEGTRPAREKVLHWIQSRAHETPGEDLLLIVARGVRPGSSPSPVEAEIRRLLDSLQGRLIEWWQEFAPGSLAVRLSDDPKMFTPRRPRADPGEGRTTETSGAARPDPEQDIPPELRELAVRVADMRIQREELSPRIRNVVLREVWIEAQAAAMENRTDFGDALERLLGVEKGLIYED